MKYKSKWFLGSKKGISFVLVACISLSLTACSGGIGIDLSRGETVDLTENRNRDAIYCWGDTVISATDYDATKVNAELTDFALKLFQKNIEMEQEDRNVLISPTSVITALGMTSYGANGDTLTQMEEAFGISRGHLNYYNRQFISNMSQELHMGNSIWFASDERLTVKDEFLQFNEEIYDADIYKAAFDQRTLRDINAWVEDETNGTIKKILDEIPEDAVMYLINALVFEAEWEEKYKETQIREGQFTAYDGEKQKVDMMYSTESLYMEDENATGVIKYYKDRDYAFVALLPNEGVDIKNYINSLSGEKLRELRSNSQEVTVYTWIPQFTTEYDVEMSEVLKSMGMKDAFDVEKANFTRLGTYTDGNIEIDRVLHKTFIEVSPVGTKAGAATVVEMLNGAAAMGPEDVKEVRLDRPFVYMIIDCENNQPIFIGAMNSVE